MKYMIPPLPVAIGSLHIYCLILNGRNFLHSYLAMLNIIFEFYMISYVVDYVNEH